MRFSILLVCVVAACSGERDQPEPRVDIHRTIADAPAWTVRYGTEFWREQSGDVGGAIERVSNAFQPTSDGATANTATFSATASPTGLRFSSGDTTLSLSTSRIAIGDQGIEGRDWSVLGNTLQRDHGVVVEHYEVLDDGVHVSWVMQERPRGAVEIDLALDGMTVGAQTATGVHFATRDGVSRVRIGNAELVDARGQRTPVETIVTDGRLSWRLDAPLLASARFPIALDPVISPELGTDQPVPGRHGEQRAPALATNGTTVLAVWNDSRGGLYATRLLADATTPLDVVGFPVSTGSVVDDDECIPSVASDGTDFLVVWTEGRRLTSLPLMGPIRGTVVTASGTVSPMVTIDGDTSSSLPSVASNGTDYLVAWQGNLAGRIRAGRVDASGTVTASIPITTSTNLETYAPAVASNGTDYLVAWYDERSPPSTTAISGDIFFARVVGTSVPPADMEGIEVGLDATEYAAPAIASDGTDYLIAWGQRESTNLLARRVTSGGVMDATPTTISAAANQQAKPAIASLGGDYFLAWVDRRSGYPDIYGARLTSTGVPSTDTNGIPIETTAHNADDPAVVAINGKYLVAHQIRRATDNDVVASYVSTSGVVDASFDLAQSPNRQFDPAAATDGTQFFVAWLDGPTFDGISATRISPTGVALDPSGISIGSNGSDLAAASNGTDFFVTWSTPEVRNRIRGSRVLADGSVPTPDGFALTSGEWTVSQPQLASDGTGYLAIWKENRDTGSRVWGVPVSAAGAMVGSPVSLSGPPPPPPPQQPFPGIVVEWHDFPAVASNGTDYLIAWTYNSTDYALRVSSTGTVTGSAITVATGSSAGAVTRLASNGADYLALWRNATEPRTTRITAGGAVDMPGGSSTLAVGEGLVGYGAGYLLVFHQGDPTLDLFGTRLDASGQPLVEDAPGFAITTTPYSEQAPSVAVIDGGPALVAYNAQSRVGVRLISFVCGNGILDVGETCDDAALVAGDGCSSMCAVEAGYACTGAPSSCTDIDECATMVDDCDQSCTNTTGSFTCSCNAGFTLATDAHTCDDVDECSTGSDGCEQDCTNTSGTYTCSCSAGYVLAGDGHACEDLDECALPGSCAAGETCENTTGSYTCTPDEGCSTTRSQSLLWSLLSLGLIRRRRRPHCSSRS